MLKIKKILVPLDFSKESKISLEWALKIAKGEKNAELYLLHVLAPNPVVPEAGLDMQIIFENHVKRAKKMLFQWQKKIPRSVESFLNVRVGDVAVECRHECKRLKIDLVVVTTQGRHGFKRMVHPNMSEKIAREVPSPVLVLHRNQKKSDRR